jgi:PAS domain S-box-containing protein
MRTVTTRHAVTLAVLAVVCSCAVQAHEVDVPRAGALHRAWGLDEGLPQNSGWALAQLPDGHLYVGTQEGLARYDGRAWVVLDHSTGMPCDEVLSLEPTPDGTLWVGTACGLVRLTGDTLIQLPTRPGAGADRITALLYAKDGTLWVGTDQGLMRLGTNLQLSPVDGLNGLDITALALADGGGAWVGTRTGGLWLARPGVAAERVSAPGALDQVTALAADGSGGVWVGTQSEGLWRRSRLGAFEPGPPGAPLRITALRAADPGGLWIGTETEGFGRLQRGGYERVEGVPPRAGVLAFLEDAEGSLWVGTFSGGVHQLRRPEVEVVGTPEGLTDDFVWSVYEDPDGAVWIGSSGGAVHRWADGKLTAYGAADGVPGGRVYDVLRDSQGTLWLATTAGAARFRQGRFEPLTTRDGLPHEGVYTLFEDAGGALWFGTRGGLARLMDGQWRVFTRADGLTRSSITNIRQAPDGGLWLGSPGGLDYLDTKTGRVRAQGPEKGLAGRDVSGVALDADDPATVWAATDDGLARVRGTELHVARGKDGLPANNLLTVVDDGRGFLWVGTNRGVFRVAKAALEAFFSGDAPRVQAVTYGRSEGMRSAECNSLSNGASLRTRSGVLWFATVAGAVRVPTGAEPGPRTPPRLEVTRVLSGGRPVDLAQGLPDGALDVELHWAAPTFVSPEKVRYRYRLEPFNQDWVKAGERREAYYTNLPPGEYHFRVQAESTDARWEPVEQSVWVRRPPRFFESRWFHVTVSLGLVGLALGAYRWRVGRLRRRAELLSQKVTERTRELADANAELKRALDTSAESERSLRRLIDRLPIAITVYHDGRAVYANQASLKLLGFDSLEALAGHTMDLHVPAEERAVWEERLRAVLRGEQLPERTARVVRGDGSVALAEVAGVALSFGGRQAVVSVARDVTEARRMEERLRLGDRMASIGTLAAGVAHEINNPLSYVIGNQQFVLERLQPFLEAPGPDATCAVPVELLGGLAEALRDASEGAARVRHIVRDLKTLSRGDEESTVSLELWPMLESAVSMCNNEVRHRARLRREQGAVPRVLANEARLVQVFLNLLVNAAQAIPDGQVEQNEIVLATWTDAAGRAVVEVRDTGCGIPREHLERIFDPFFTTKPLGVGTGLGLSICHGIIHALGGELQVESTQGKGTTFRVVLPPASTKETSMELSQMVPKQPRTQDAKRARLLVLDDEPLVARGVARLLAIDYAAESACSARETLARLAQGERFDLMLCDLMMPEMSGEAFFKQLEEVAPDQREHVVFVTGGAFTPEARHFLESLPPGRFVHKPLGAEALRALVREHLARAA